MNEIQEIDSPGIWEAALGLTITLLDMGDPDLSTQLIFQKSFRVLEPMPQKTPAGLAQATSKAMQRLSQEILGEVYQAVRKRLRSPVRAKEGKNPCP